MRFVPHVEPCQKHGQSLANFGWISANIGAMLMISGQIWRILADLGQFGRMFANIVRLVAQMWSSSAIKMLGECWARLATFGSTCTILCSIRL